MRKPVFLLIAICVVTSQVSCLPEEEDPQETPDSEYHYGFYDHEYERGPGIDGDQWEPRTYEYTPAAHDSIEVQGLAEPEIPFNFDSNKLVPGPTSDTHGPPCSYDEYLDAARTTCVRCPSCPPGQRLSEPCGRGNRPSENLKCVGDCGPDFYWDDVTQTCIACTNCAMYKRDVVHRCTPGSNTVCRPDCWEGYEVRIVQTLAHGNNNLYACQNANPRNMSLFITVGSAVGVLCFVIPVCCCLWARRRDQNMIQGHLVRNRNRPN